MKETLLGIIGNKFILYGLIAVIVVFILIFLIIKLSKHGNYYDKAIDLHRKAENFHIFGKDKKAEKLNEKAEEYRTKAKGIEA